MHLIAVTICIVFVCSSGGVQSEQVLRVPSVCDYSFKYANPEFKKAHEAWCIAIESPEIAFQSVNEAYQQIPEYQAMIKIGEPALNDLEALMEGGVGMYHMLYLAVIEIMGWNEADFLKPLISNQERTNLVLIELKASR